MRYTGKLKFFDSGIGHRNFGFIFRDGSNDQDFLHISSLERSGVKPEALTDGVTLLSYELETRPNGRSHAVNIKILD